jgi:anti-sigma B factor antagonist
VASNVKTRQAGKVTILEPSGRLMIGATPDELDEKLQGFVAGGTVAVLLDCGQISFIDSQGIKVPVRGVTSLDRRGGELKLLKLSPQVRRVLEITRLLAVFESFEDETVALRGLKSQAEGGRQ